MLLNKQLRVSLTFLGQMNGMDLDQSEIKLYIIKPQQNTVHHCIFVQNKKP